MPHIGQPILKFETDGCLELSKAHWAQVSYLPARLVVRVGAIHDAVKIDAVLDAKHVPDFVDHDSARISKKNLISIW